MKHPSKHPLYAIWYQMIRRCHSKKATGYEYYGAKGVIVCDRWRESFEAFINDVGPQPRRYTLERLDPTGNYEPDNVEWASYATQGKNKRVGYRRKCFTQITDSLLTR